MGSAEALPRGLQCSRAPSHAHPSHAIGGGNILLEKGGPAVVPSVQVASVRVAGQ